MKNDKITWIFFILLLTGVIGGIFNLLRLSQFPIKKREVTVKEKIKLEKQLQPLPTKIKPVYQKPIPAQPSKPNKFGTISILSSPAGAKIYLDAILQTKRTPMVSKIKTGTHQIKLVKNGYQPYQSEIIIKQGLTTCINAKLELSLASVFISSTPPGATVFVNNEKKGITPLTISPLIPWQPYQLQLSLSKYNDWSANIFVEPGEETKMEVRLKPKPEGFIYVTSIPSGAMVYLDDELIGKTPVRELTVRVGNHTLKVNKEGFFSAIKKVNVPVAESVFVNFELTSESSNQ
ncbi:MAG: PEGA domain-containing protein [bacterium]